MLDYCGKLADDRTVVFHYEPAVLHLGPTPMAVTGIVRKHAYDSATYGASPVGSGRYVLKQWDRGQQVILRQIRITTAGSR